MYTAVYMFFKSLQQLFQQFLLGFFQPVHPFKGWLTRKKCFEPLWLNEECKNGIQSGLESMSHKKTKQKNISKVERQHLKRRKKKKGFHVLRGSELETKRARG